MRMGLDVDLCVVATDNYWMDWMFDLTSHWGKFNIIKENKLDYNLAKYWADYEDSDKLMDFWRAEGLYDNFTPIPEAKKELDLLSQYGFDIVFISSVKGNHNKSKYYFLKKYFPYLKAYLSTKEKHFVDVDIMIDDRTTNLLPFKDKVKLIRYDTIYKQDCEDTDRITVCKTWEDIYNEVMKYKQEQEWKVG